MSNSPITLERINASLAIVAQGIKMHGDYGAMPIFDRLESMKQKLIDKDKSLDARDEKLQNAIDRVA